MKVNHVGGLLYFLFLSSFFFFFFCVCVCKISMLTGHLSIYTSGLLDIYLLQKGEEIWDQNYPSRQGKEKRIIFVFVHLFFFSHFPVDLV